jgi:uncharacterized membrane protein
MSRVRGEWRFLILFTASVVLLIVITGILAPNREDRDFVPTTWNTGRAGAKAAWLLLGDLGYRAVRWERPESDLSAVDAGHATLVAADPSLGFGAIADKDRIQPFADFLRRGGRILATGPGGALLLPDAKIGESRRVYTGLCDTTPAGPDALARAGSVSMAVPMRWTRDDPEVRVAQRCGDDAVVVSYAVGRGEVIWWASSTPLSNAGLRNDGNLRLLLASIGGTDRTIYFDERLHGISDDPWSAAQDTPVTALIVQSCCVGALLLFSFSRGAGPRRTLVQPPRASPLEFVESMGALYARAGASRVAVSAAERRLLAFLLHEGGIPMETLRSSPSAIAAAVSARFGCDTAALAADLEAARQAEYDARRPSEALILVRRLDEHIAHLTALIRNPQRTPIHKQANA